MKDRADTIADATRRRQPVWKLLANLGDVNPLDYGGYFVFIDETGVYPPEAEVLEEPCEEDGQYTVYRFILERCTLTNGVLSDNPYHPLAPVWFADAIGDIADTVGSDATREVQDMLCSADPLERAHAYRDVASHFGWHEFDHDALRLTAAEAEARYAKHGVG
jgi:hypothetical protein